LLTVIDCTDSEKGTICLKSKHANALAALQDKISENGRAGRINIFELEDFYPAWDEFILVNEVLEKTVPEGGIPLNVLAVVNPDDKGVGHSVVLADITLVDNVRNSGGGFLQKLGKLPEIKIVGLPPDIDKNKALEKIGVLLESH